MRKSTGNVADRIRAAMVYHYAEAGTHDSSEARNRYPSPIHDWMPVRRS